MAMNQNDNNKKIVCPDCRSEIKKTENMEVGDILECGECELRLRFCL